MKQIIILLSLVLFSCTPKLNIHIDEPIVYSVFENECRQEYLIEFHRLNQIEKEFALYFEKRILKRYEEYQWISCGNNLNTNQRKVMAKWWSVQGILNTPTERRQSSVFAYLILLSMGNSKDEIKEFLYAIMERDFFDVYKINVCAFKPRNYKFQ
jgi:hypothetical protein